MFCWLWAAYPPTTAGRLSSGRIAASLGVSARTLRRWISEDRTDLLTPQQRAQLSRRAILRGRGTYLWPLVDATTAWRVDAGMRTALDSLALVNTPARIPDTWHCRHYLSPHTVYLLHYPRAHVYGIAFAQHHKHHARLYRHAEVIDERTVPNRWAALAQKLATLQDHRATHCTAPRSLVPTGRTEVLRATTDDPPKLTDRIVT